MKGLGFGVQDLSNQKECERVSGFGFRVQGPGFRVQGAGSRVEGLHLLLEWRP